MTENMATAVDKGDIFKSLILKGILMIILGFIMFIFTLSSLIAIDYFFGFILIILGIQLLTSGSTFLGECKHTWWVIILGILAILLGICAFIMPGVMLIYIVYLIAITIFISGFTDLGIAIMNKTGGANRVLIAITGILGIILGVIFIAMPFLAAVTLAQITGIFLLIFGIFAIAEGFMAKNVAPEAT